MFHSRAKPHKIEKFIERLEAADAALCNAALCNVLTKRNDEHMRGLVQIIRREIEAAKRAAAKNSS